MVISGKRASARAEMSAGPRLPGALRLDYLFSIFLVALVIVLVLFGGSSRYDQLAQIPVRLIALATIALASFQRITAPATSRVPALLLLASLCLVGLQLIPLPPGVWETLPDRRAFAAASTVAGFPQPWRPIALSPDLALNAFLSLAVPVAVFYGLATSAPRRLKLVLPVLLIVVAVAAFMGILQLATGADGLTIVYAQRGTGTAAGIFTNRNHQALLLAIGLPLIGGWWAARRFQSNDRGSFLIALAGLAFLLMILLATGSRAGLGLGGIGLVGALVVAWPHRRVVFSQVRFPNWLLGLLATGAVAGLLAATFFLGRGQSIERLIAADPMVDRRALSLPTVFEILKANFPVGTGFGSFDAAFRRAEPFSLLDTTYFNQAHSDLVQVVLEGGAVGLVLLVAGAIWLGQASIRLFLSRHINTVIVHGRSAAIAAWMIVGASSVDYPLRTPIVMAVAAALVFQISWALAELRGSSESKT